MGQVLAKEKLKITSTNIPKSIPPNCKGLLGPISLHATENPGSMQELHKTCQNVMPVCFDGIKIHMNNLLSNHFQTAHAISMMNGSAGMLSANSDASSGYKFSTTYVDTTLADTIETFRVLYGDIDTAGNMTANMHYITPCFRYRYAGQFSTNPSKVVGQFTGDLIGPNYTASMAMLNMNPLKQPELIIGQYLQAVTNNVALGAEICYNNSVGLHQTNNRLTISGTFRVQNGASLWTGVIGDNGIHVCAHRRASKNLQIGVETSVNFRLKQATTTLAYQVDLPEQNFIFRGMIDSNGLVGSVLEKRLEPIPLTFALSVLCDHSKQHIRLGCGVTLK